MIKIGITGSLASGKSTASKILSNKRGPLFSADKVVAQLYRNKRFNSLISKKFKIKNNSQLKEVLKELILTKKQNLKKLEKIVQPLVRSKMREFTLKNKKKKNSLLRNTFANREKINEFLQYHNIYKI